MAKLGDFCFRWCKFDAFSIRGYQAIIQVLVLKRPLEVCTRMKVTMVGNFGLWNKGTMGVRALPMAKALAGCGHQVCIVLPSWDAPEDSGLEYEIDGVEIANVKLPPRIPLLWHALLTISVIRRTLREPSDVIHIFKPKAYAGLVGILVWLLKKVGLLHTRLVVDTDDWEGTGGWNDIERFPRFIKWFISWHERVGLRCCDTVTTASRALELLAWSVGVRRNAVHYVPNGAFVGDVQPVSFEVSSALMSEIEKSDNPIILLYTRFFEYRLEKVVRVLRAVLELEPAARLLVIGKGLRGEESDLAEMLRAAGISDKVIFAGWIDKDDVPKWLRFADVAIYPMDDSLLNRSKCPMKLVDLMVNGLPIVAEAVGQVAEYIENGVSGLLVDPDDILGFSDAIVSLFNDDAARKRLGEGARERIVEKFEWRRLIARVEVAYGLPMQRSRTEGVIEAVVVRR